MTVLAGAAVQGGGNALTLSMLVRMAGLAAPGLPWPASWRLEGALPLPQKAAQWGERLRALLRRVGFTQPAIVQRMGVSHRMWDGQGADNRRKALRYLMRAPRTPLDALIRLLQLNIPMGRRHLARFIGEGEVALLHDLGLLKPGPWGSWVCDLAVFECEGQVFVTDPMARAPRPVNPVMPMLPESYEFDANRSRRPVADVLDLGCGCGVHALRSAAQAARVLGCDISLRAVQFARFNAALNEVTNVEFACGDLWAPAQGRAFDLVLANPPYVPSTAGQPGDNYRCGGALGDVLVNRVLQGLARHLRPGGMAQVMHLMVLQPGQSHEARLQAVLGDFAGACSVVVMSNPVAARHAALAPQARVEFGMTCIRRHAGVQAPFFLHVPFRARLHAGLSDLFDLLERTSRAQQAAAWAAMADSEPLTGAQP